jgi:flavin-dependent dehydrogenase
VIDVLVVGGGPVGLVAAIEARLAGLSVTILEPRDDAIDKACGEGLMPGAIPLLARLGVDPPGMPLRGVSYRQGTRVADYRFASGEGRGVRRLALHTALAERAASLGVMREVGRVDTVSQSVDDVTAGGITARWLLACDGLHSTVRRATGLDIPVAYRGRRYGLRQHFAVAPWSDLIEVHWSRAVEAYVTPVSEGVTGIAILGRQGTDFGSALESIPELYERVADAAPASTLRGAGPFRQRARHPSAGRVLLVGDASGYVDAITGEGLRLGFEQARAAVASIRSGDAGSYDAEWTRITRDFRVLTEGLVRAATSPVRGAIVPLAAALPGVYGRVVERLAR